MITFRPAMGRVYLIYENLASGKEGEVREDQGSALSSGVDLKFLAGTYLSAVSDAIPLFNIVDGYPVVLSYLTQRVTSPDPVHEVIAGAFDCRGGGQGGRIGLSPLPAGPYVQ